MIEGLLNHGSPASITVLEDWSCGPTITKFIRFRAGRWSLLTDDVTHAPRSAFLQLRQDVGLEGQRRHAEEQLPNILACEAGRHAAVSRSADDKPLRASRQNRLSASSDSGTSDPPDRADTAQYSALISSAILMASSSI